MWCGLIKLAYLPGAVVASFSFMSNHLRMWVVIFICWQSSSYVGSRFHAGALVLYVGSCLHTGTGGCGHGCGCIVVVEGCGGGSGHGLWSLHHRCGRIVDMVVDVVRGCVVVLVC